MKIKTNPERWRPGGDGVERWKPSIADDQYLVSNKGRVLSLVGAQPKIIKQRERSGYPSVSIRGRDCVVHRLVAEAFLGPADGLHVNHKNGVKVDNRLVNLEYVTPQENTAHAINVLGKNRSGEDCGTSILMEQEVRFIRDCYAAGVTGQTLAREFNTSASNISAIVTRKTWRHIA